MRELHAKRVKISRMTFEQGYSLCYQNNALNAVNFDGLDDDWWQSGNDIFR